MLSRGWVLSWGWGGVGWGGVGWRAWVGRERDQWHEMGWKTKFPLTTTSDTLHL